MIPHTKGNTHPLAVIYKITKNKHSHYTVNNCYNYQLS